MILLPGANIIGREMYSDISLLHELVQYVEQLVHCLHSPLQGQKSAFSLELAAQKIHLRQLISRRLEQCKILREQVHIAVMLCPFLLSPSKYCPFKGMLSSKMLHTWHTIYHRGAGSVASLMQLSMFCCRRHLSPSSRHPHHAKTVDLVGMLADTSIQPGTLLLDEVSFERARPIDH